MTLKNRVLACFREPLAVFVAAALAVFGLYGLYSEPEKETIVITSAMVQDIVQYRTEILGRMLTEEEERQLIEEYVNSEILVREAVARGLHRKDGVVRKRLVDKLNFLLEEEPPAPTSEQLDAVYRADPARFHNPPTISFEHIYFVDDKRAAEARFRRLQRGDSEAEKDADRFWLGRHMEEYSNEQLLTLFGFEFVTPLRNAPTGEWYGPLRSGRGYHIVRVTQRRAAAPPPAEVLRKRLEDYWIRAQRVESRRRNIDALSDNYEILLPGDAGVR